MPFVWVILFVVLIIIEICTQGLTTIWFAGGSLLAALLSFVGAPLWLQITVFFVISLLLLIFTRPVLKKKFESKLVDTNIETLIGKVAVVTKVVNNLQNEGTVNLDGMEWTARSESDYIVLNPEEKVVVKAIQGVKLIVSRMQ